MERLQLVLGGSIVILLLVAIYIFVLPTFPVGSFFPFEALPYAQSYLALDKTVVLQGEPISVAVGVFGTGDPFTSGLSPSYYYVGYLLDGQFIGFEQAGAREYTWSDEHCTAWTDECTWKFKYSLSTFPAFFRLIKGVYSYQINTAALPVGKHSLAVAYSPVHPGSDYRNESDLFQMGASCDAHLTGSSYGIDQCRVFGWSKGYSLQSSFVCSGSGSTASCPQPYQPSDSDCRNACCQPSWCGGGWCSSTAPANCSSGSSGRVETCNCSNGRRGLSGGWSESVIFSKTREQALSELGWDVLASVEFEVVSEVSCGVGFQHPSGDLSQCVAIECPVGYVLSGSDCVPIACGAGYHLVGSDCVLDLQPEQPVIQPLSDGGQPPINFFWLLGAGVIAICIVWLLGVLFDWW
jgi:hypothetical protein